MSENYDTLPRHMYYLAYLTFQRRSPLLQTKFSYKSVSNKWKLQLNQSRQSDWLVLFKVLYMNSSFRPAYSKLNAFHQEHVHIKGLCKQAVWGVNFCSAWFKRSSSEKGATVGIRTDRWQTFQNQIVKFFSLFPNCDQIVKVQTMLSTCFSWKLTTCSPPALNLWRQSYLDEIQILFCFIYWKSK